jgi:hypothetical protein
MALVFLFSLTGQMLNFDFAYLQELLPFSKLVSRVPLVSLTALYIESNSGLSESTRFVVTSTLFVYVFAISLFFVSLANLTRNDLLDHESLTPQLFYWFAFIAICCFTLLFFPIEIWGRSSLAYRLAVQSDLRYFLFAVMVSGLNLFYSYLAAFVRLKFFDR